MLLALLERITLPHWILLPVGLLLLLKGADWLVHGAVALARRLGFSPLVIGLTVVAFGTSAPELFVNVIAAVNGNPGLSFGNIVGSNIVNIGVVVGVGALIAPIQVHGRVLGKELPWMIAVSAAALPIAWLPPDADGARGFGRVDGAIMLAVFAIFCAGWYRAARRDAADPLAQEAVAQARAEGTLGLPAAFAFFVAGLAMLLLGGKLTEVGAVDLAGRLGLSNALIGLTVVAIATSLPELFTVIVAARRGHSDLALGNVVGSNVFNLLLVLGVTAVIAPVPVPGFGGWQDLAMMLLMSCMLWIVAATKHPSVSRAEGALLLVAYTVYMTWSVLREGVLT